MGIIGYRCGYAGALQKKRGGRVYQISAPMWRKPSGEPIINGTGTPVRAIVELWRSGMSAQEIPSHLPHEYGPDLRCPELSQRKSGRDQIVTSSGTAYPVCFVSSAMGDRWNKRVLFEIGKTDVFAPGRSSDFPGSPAIFLYFNNHPFGIGSLDCRYDVPIDGAAAGTADRCG